jgi:hypothetical protein
LFYGEEVELDAFQLITDTIRDDPDAPRLLTGVFHELADLQRRQAAIYLIEREQDNQNRFTLAVLNEFDELHDQSQPRVIDAILRAPQFADAEVQRMTVRAIEDEISTSQRRELLQRVEAHPRTTTETLAVVRSIRD